MSMFSLRLNSICQEKEDGTSYNRCTKPKLLHCSAEVLAGIIRRYSGCVPDLSDWHSRVNPQVSKTSLFCFVFEQNKVAPEGAD